MDRRKFIINASNVGFMTFVFKTAALSFEVSKNENPNCDNVIGKTKIYITKHEDTLLDIARNNGLGFVELVAANAGVDPWVPGKQREIIIPGAHLIPEGPRKGMLLNLIDQRMYLFTEPNSVVSYPIGTGREAWDTPIGTTNIVRKKYKPTWFVPNSVRKEDPNLPAIIKPGPDNPLGNHAFYLGWPAYLIHGTNQPWGVGRRVSHGCIRMYPEDIAKIFDKIDIGTHVTVVKQEAKIEWVKNDLMLEVHPNGKQNLELERTGTFTFSKVPELAYRIKEKAGKRLKDVDWNLVKRIENKRQGIPMSILVKEKRR